MSEIRKLQVEAEQAVRSLQGPALESVTRYLTALAEKEASDAMYSPSHDDVLRKQGNYRGLVKMLNLLNGETTSQTKRSKLKTAL